MFVAPFDVRLPEGDEAAVSFFPGLEIDLAAVFEEMDFEEHAPEKGGKSLSRIHVK